MISTFYVIDKSTIRERKGTATYKNVTAEDHPNLRLEYVRI
ncbi:hypothetical protein THF5G08_40164 [Vibrio jasicida]|nr:hypothetical protein THF5G08_40164 [Vibrio jasicida]